MILFINFKRKYKIYKKEINQALEKVFKRGWFILGPEVEKFEKNFAQYLRIKHIIGVGSGTDAIFLALKALGIGQGDEVITVANTAVPTISAIRMTGARPVFVDINEETFNINATLIEEKISPKTKVILPVHLYGYPSNMGEIMKIAKKYNLKVVEDVCQAHGARYKGRLVGTIGDIGCFSFYPTKNLGAFGDAGAIVTNNKKIVETVMALRKYGQVGRFSNKSREIRSRLDELQAAILNWGLNKLDLWNKKREELAKIYLENLKNLPLDLPPRANQDFKPVWHLFVIRAERRDQLKEFLEKKGIQTIIHYPQPIFEQEVYKSLNYKAKDLPITKKVSKKILSLPLYPELEKKEVLRVCKAIKSFYDSRK